jgi:hypothetical protein
MPRLISFRLVAACALALVFVFSLSAGASAFTRSIGPHLHVVGKGGKVLAEKSFAVDGDVSIKASPNASCFGSGTGGSGKSVKMKEATALGMLLRASKFTAALRPVLITDAFDFGLGICGIGGSTASTKASWYLKVNHKNPNLGGEMVRIERGDEVLWALASFPYPKELSLVAPFSAHPGEPFQVRVFSYDDKGKRKPAAGVTVTGASGPTDASGYAMVTLSDTATLIARHGKDIPSNSERVRMCLPNGACPKA